METIKTHIKSIVAVCTYCGNKTKISYAHTVWYRCKPYCWSCRNCLIAKWVEQDRLEKTFDIKKPNLILDFIKRIMYIILHERNLTKS